MTTVIITQPPTETARPRLYSEIEKKGVYNIFLPEGQRLSDLLVFVDGEPYFSGGVTITKVTIHKDHYRYLPAKDAEVTITINNK